MGNKNYISFAEAPTWCMIKIKFKKLTQGLQATMVREKTTTTTTTVFICTLSCLKIKLQQ